MQDSEFKLLKAQVWALNRIADQLELANSLLLKDARPQKKKKRA